MRAVVPKLLAEKLQGTCEDPSQDSSFLKEQLKHVVKDSSFGLDLNHNSTTKDSAILDRSLKCFKLWCPHLWEVIVRIKLADSWD